MDISSGSLRRSSLRPAPRDRTDHFSVQLQATAVSSLLSWTVWPSPEAACVDQVCDQRRRPHRPCSVQLQATAVPSLLRWTVRTPPAAACVGHVRGQRREVAPTMLSPAAGHGHAIAPELDGVDTSGGSVCRSG